MFIKDTPPKFQCDYCGDPIEGDNVCFFYRGRHLHPDCFPHAVETIKYQDLRGEKTTTPIRPKAPKREFKPVDLTRNQYGFPKDHLPDGSL